MYLATEPPNRATALAHASRKAPMMRPRSSGSSCVDNAVEPTRSQNITVSCRRSADDATAGAGDLVSGSAGTIGSLMPQFAQNFAADGLPCPQKGHASGSVAPHSVQNLLPSATSALQLEHTMPHLTPLKVNVTQN